jgi:hypothetical protein
MHSLVGDRPNATAFVRSVSATKLFIGETDNESMDRSGAKAEAHVVTPEAYLAYTKQYRSLYPGWKIVATDPMGSVDVACRRGVVWILNRCTSHDAAAGFAWRENVHVVYWRYRPKERRWVWYKYNHAVSCIVRLEFACRCC